MQTKFVHLIADYGTGDPAFGEVIQKLALLAPEIRVIPTSVPKFSTIATGFWTYQYALVNPVPGMLIYTNTAPRRDVKAARDKNEGEILVYTELANGVRVVGVNAGHCFSFLKPVMKTIHAVAVANKGSQFRSRDFYPEAVVGLAGGDNRYLGQQFDSLSIPDVPERRIAWIDGYGNLKTTTRRSTVTFTVGERVLVNLNGIKRTAYFSDGTFAVHHGQLAFAPGSSGGDDPFMEIFLRGLSAWQEFGKPVIESAFTVEPDRD